MAGRAVLSYDDLTQPSASSSSQTPSFPASASAPISSESGPPNKKPRWMKTPKGRGGGGGQQHQQQHHSNYQDKRERARVQHLAAHWDASNEASNPTVISYDAEPPASTSSSAAVPPPKPTSAPSANTSTANGSTPSKKRQHPSSASAPAPSPSVSLMDTNAWDDSSLIDAWEAANEEYERMNGPGKSWKTEPVYKSSVWYADSTTSKPDSKAGTGDASMEADSEEVENVLEGEEEYEEMEEPEGFSIPIPALPSMPAFPADMSQQQQEHEQYSIQDVFNQALNSAYWLGYWSALHKQKVEEASSNQAEQETENQVEETS